MTTTAIGLTVDTEASAAYIQLSDKTIIRTAQVTNRVNVDLDDLGVAVGIELLTLRGPYPIEDIIAATHVRSEQEASIRGLLVGDLAQLTIQTTSGGASSRGLARGDFLTI